MIQYGLGYMAPVYFVIDPKGYLQYVENKEDLPARLDALMKN